MIQNKEIKAAKSGYFILGLCIGFFMAGLFSLPGKEHIIKMISIGIFGSLLELFLQFCYAPGNIFNWYYRIIEKFYENPKNKLRELAKPLGLCAYCQNIWIIIITFTVVVFTVGISWWMILPSLVVGHLSLAILDKVFWQ